jgi:hypothetical protein
MEKVPELHNLRKTLVSEVYTSCSGERHVHTWDVLSHIVVKGNRSSKFMVFT